MTWSDLASRLALARRDACIATLRSSDGISSVDDAYRIQTEIAASDRVGVGGWKVTALAAADQEKFLSNRPVAGILLGTHVHTAPATIPLSSFVSPLLECEIAFRLKRDLEERKSPYRYEEIEAAVEDIAAVFEIADCRVPPDAPDLLKLSDCMGNGALIVGSQMSARKEMDLSGIGIVLQHNGREIGRGNSSNILGNPLRALLALANAQPLPAGGLRKGQIVTTGTCTRPIELVAGEFVATFSLLGSVKLTVS